MSLNQSFNITTNSLKNNQYALTVVAQNISNVNTEGYVRQRVNFETNDYTTDCENVISTIKGMNGASVASLTDYIDQAAFNDLVNSNADAQYYSDIADELGNLEDIMDSLGDDGLNGLLNDFYTAAANLEQYPADITMRQQYVIAAQNVCDKFNDISKQYDETEADSIENLTTNIDTINGLLSDLAESNEAYIKGGKTAQLQSDTNSVLAELSNYMNITTETNSNGTINLYIGSVAVVQGCDQLYTVNANIDQSGENPKADLYLKSTDEDETILDRNINSSVTSGSLKAQLEFINDTNDRYSSLADVKKAINDAASSFATAINDIQIYDETDSEGNEVFAASLTMDGDDLVLEKASVPMFDTTDGSSTITAGNIQVNSEITKNPYLVSAARIDTSKYTQEELDNEDWKKAIGNSDNATLISDVQNQKICSGSTLSQFLTNLAAKNGLDKNNYSDKADTYGDIADTAQTNYTNLIGVNLDEELADMIKYQRSYEASATLFSTINDVYSTLINMV